MLRKIIVAITILVFYLLQCTLFKALSLASVSPNLLLIITFVAGFMVGKKEGMYVGLFSGLILDIFYGDVIGFNAILYMYIGYINGFFNAMFYDEDVTLPVGLICASDLAYNFFYYIFNFLLRNCLDFPYYFIHIILPEMIYTVVIMLLIYRPILKIHRKLSEYEKRSATKFV